MDALVKNGYRVIERRRIQDVIQKEIKKATDLWFDQARIAQFGKLIGADFVVTADTFCGEGVCLRSAYGQSMSLTERLWQQTK